MATAQFNYRLESKLEKYKALQSKISQSIEQVVNKELTDKSRENITQTLDGLKSVRSGFQKEFRNLTVLLHRELLDHFETFQFDTAGFSLLHEIYMRHLERLNERNEFMTSECDGIVTRIQEIYKNKIEELRNTEEELRQKEEQLADTRHQLSYQQMQQQYIKPSGPIDDDTDSVRSWNSRTSQSIRNNPQSLSEASSPVRGGLFGKMKSIIKGNNREGIEPIPEMKLGEPAKFHWDAVKKRYVFEGEGDQQEEEAPLPSKRQSEILKREDVEATIMASRAQSSMKKRQTIGGSIVTRSLSNVFRPSGSNFEELKGSNLSGLDLSNEKTLFSKLFDEIESLISRISVKHISSSSYVQPLNEVIALAQEDAAQLHEHESELEAARNETQKAIQALNTYEAFSTYKDETIRKLMESQRDLQERSTALEMEKDGLLSTLDLYQELLQSGGGSGNKATDGSTEASQNDSQSSVQERHLEFLINEIAAKERIAQLTDEVNALRLREGEIEFKLKMCEEKAEMYRKQLEERENDQAQAQALFAEKYERDEVALKLMTKAYELGHKLESSQKKIQSLNKLCKQISDEVSDKNSQISELTSKVKKAENKSDEKEGVIQSCNEKIKELENEISLANKERKVLSSLQNEHSAMQKSLDNSKKEVFTLSNKLNDAIKQSQAHQEVVLQLTEQLNTIKLQKDVFKIYCWLPN